MQNIIKKISILFICFSLISCATPYKQAKSILGDGYFDRNLGSSTDSFFISFNGNEFVSIDEARNYALLRACEVCLENGFVSFDIINRVEDTTYSTEEVTTYDKITNYGYTYPATSVITPMPQTVTTITKNSVNTVVTTPIPEIVTMPVMQTNTVYLPKTETHTTIKPKIKIYIKCSKKDDLANIASVWEERLRKQLKVKKRN